MRQGNNKVASLRGDSFLLRYSYLFFIFFFLMALWAFWTSYYGKLLDEHPASIRFHGSTMTLWCLMLIIQPFLIRLNKRNIHRWVGKLSYVLVPFILFSGAHLAHGTILQSPPASPSYYFSIALMYNSLIVFAILYGLAIWHRKNAPLHARFMISTVFPLFTPVTDRLIYKYFESLIPLAPTMEDGMPMVPGLGFALADLIILCLAVWDWRVHKRLSVFPFVLALLMLYHLSVLTFYKYDFWKKMGDLMMTIPLS